jgi:hypothetical protein
VLLRSRLEQACTLGDPMPLPDTCPGRTLCQEPSALRSIVAVKIRWWELVLGPISALLALGFVVDGLFPQFAFTAVVSLWIGWRVLRRYPVALLFARRALRRWRLGPRAMVNTVALGLRLDRLFTPALSAKRLRHGPTSSGWAYPLYLPIVRAAASAQTRLCRLSFYETSDTLALSEPLRSLRDLAVQLDAIDQSLTRSSGGTARLEVYATGHGRLWSAAEAVQATLEATLARRDGADGAWFRGVIAKRREILHALGEGHSTMTKIEQKAVWMLERQREQRSGNGIALVDAAAVRDELRSAAQLVSALTDGVGEAYVDPPATTPVC